MSDQKPAGINISVLNDVIVFEPSKCRAVPGQTVSWTCAQGPFAVQFFGISPLVTYDAQSDVGGHASRSVRTDAKPGIYPYAVAVCVDRRVYLDASCPAIIIDQP